MFVVLCCVVLCCVVLCCVVLCCVVLCCVVLCCVVLCCVVLCCVVLSLTKDRQQWRQVVQQGKSHIGKISKKTNTITVSVMGSHTFPTDEQNTRTNPCVNAIIGHHEQ